MSVPRSPPISPSSTSTPAPTSRIPYSSTFEDGLMTILLNPPSTPTGITILPQTSSEQSIPGQQLHPRDIPSLTLPTILPADIPLPIDDPRRIYRSPIDGLLLTHPFGALEGGPGPTNITGPETDNPSTTGPSENVNGEATADGAQIAKGEVPETTTTAQSPTSNWSPEEQRAYVTQFIRKNRIRSAGKLARQIERDSVAQLDELRKRMKARQKAIDANRGVERQIRELEQQREVERRVEEGVRRRLGLKS